MKAQRLQYALENFVEKMSGVNKPYLALKKTPAYEDFYVLMQGVIAYQMQWAAKHIHQILETAPRQPLNNTQKARAKSYIEHNMPSVGDLVLQTEIVKYYKFFFNWGAKAQYQRWFSHRNKIRKTGELYDAFSLTNKDYIDQLNNDANFLLNKSSLDSTTTNNIINLIQTGKGNLNAEGLSEPLTNEEIAQQIADQYDTISSARADMITRTETANAMGDGNFATMDENNIAQYSWVTAGDNPCPICDENEAASPINMGDEFPSGDISEPAHPNCECYTEADPESINLDDYNIWDGSAAGSTFADPLDAEGDPVVMAADVEPPPSITATPAEVRNLPTVNDIVMPSKERPNADINLAIEQAMNRPIYSVENLRAAVDEALQIPTPADRIAMLRAITYVDPTTKKADSVIAGLVKPTFDPASKKIVYAAVPGTKDVATMTTAEILANVGIK